MKTLILSMSPRRSFSASLYFSRIVSLFLPRGDTRVLELKTEQQYAELERLLPQAENLLFATPVYVDSIPSTVLEKLQKLERFSEGKQIKPNVYALTNCGFYEGEQCELAQHTFSLWCRKCGFAWKGGLGVGAGVMLSFIRTLIPIGLAVTALELIIRLASVFFSGVPLAEAIHHYFPYTLVIQSALYLLWSMGLFVNAFRLSRHIKRSSFMDIRYTTAWFCPRFLFVVIASAYWVLASIFWYHGAFWRLHKEPRQSSEK